MNVAKILYISVIERNQTGPPFFVSKTNFTMRRLIISFLAFTAMLAVFAPPLSAQPNRHPEADPNAVFPPEGTYLPSSPQVLNLDSVCGLIRIGPEIRNAQVHGKALIRIAVDKTGRYAGHKVIRSPHPRFTHEIEKHLYHLRFTTWTTDQNFNRVWIMIPFALDLRE